MTNPISELSALYSAGSGITFNFLTLLNGDAATFGSQLIAYGQAGSQLIGLGLNQLASSLPALPTLP